MNAYDILKERGFVAQVTYEDELRKAFDDGMVTFYTGFDPTADRLHVGHFIPRDGHGASAARGSPPDRADRRRHRHGRRSVRQERTCARCSPCEEIDHNVACFKTQMANFLDFDESKPNCAIIANNADWLRTLNYIDFLRDVGVLFSVNRMLAAECYKQRLRARADVPRVQLHAHAVLRLPRAEPPLRLHAADRRRRPVVEHALRRGPDPPQGSARRRSR